MDEARARGALLGMAVGDALGTTFEFETIDQPAYPTLATGPATDIVGEGPFHLEAGQITDDTQLAVCLARSLADHGRTLDVGDVAARYVAWMEHAFDIGTQTGGALRRIARGDLVTVAARAAWIEGGRRAAGNGSLMRIAPLAVAYARRGDLDRMARAAIDDSLITHADPRCALACAAFVRGIAAAGGDVVAAARDGLEQGRAYLSRHWPDEIAAIDEAARDLEGDLDAAQSADPGVYRPGLHLHGTAGFVRVAFRLAFWHALRARDYAAAVVDVASRGGDADTNAAIVGALVGARDGESAISPAWRERVLGATQPGPAEWAEAHHPRHLLLVV